MDIQCAPTTQETALPIGELSSPTRLLILIPNWEVNENHLVHWLQSALITPMQEAKWVLLGLLSAQEPEYQTRQRLGLLAAHLSSKSPKLEITICLAKTDWLTAVNQHYRPGDWLVCHSEQMIRRYGWQRRALATCLRQEIEAPLLVTSGFYSTLPVEPLNHRGEWFSSLIFLGILTAFSIVQYKLTQITQHHLYVGLLLVSLIFEYMAIGFWHRMSA